METDLTEQSSLESKLPRDFYSNLKLEDEEKKIEENQEQEEEESDEEEEEDVEEEEEEFSFSLAFDGIDNSEISAEELFQNGQIKPVFPFFNQDLLLAGAGAGAAPQDGESMENLIANDRVPDLRKVFVEVGNEADGFPPTASTSGSGEVAGPYCDWSKKAVVEVAPQGCKKSNSTGFSKIWRFKEFMHRSSSDGRDAFVFLNNPAAVAAREGGNKEEKAAARKPEKKKEVAAESNKVKVKGGEGKVKAAGKVKRVIKAKTATLSAHEVYMRSKAKEEERRRSYLPYRPEVVGFFTNITGGGLTKNVHPF